MARRRNKREGHRDGQGDICGLFFEGGRDEVREILTSALRKARKQKGVTGKSLDDMCYFREDGLPTCNEFERDPSKMTQEVFCRAACALGLKVDEVLTIKLSKEKLATVLHTMDLNEAGLTAALHVTKVQPIPNIQVAPVYALFKILSEI